ncbi:MAG: M20/M25/M40 family metallo-hydrolase, partial [Sphingobacterium sp.]
MNDKLADLIEAGTSLLQELIRIPSFSREENGTADLLCHFLQQRGVEVHRYGNNVWAYNKYKDDLKPCVLLNSHHDTVKPNAGYTKDPFEPILEDGKLFGLGSNDAGGCLVALISAFLYFYDQEDLAYNICFLASAEEEVSGKN